jgi:hypothetical protein
MMHLHAVTWGDISRIVGNPSLTELGKDCPSTDRIMLEAWFRALAPDYTYNPAASPGPQKRRIGGQYA